MTINEAIEIIRTIKNVGYFTDKGNMAFDKAIEALEKETMYNELLNNAHGYWRTPEKGEGIEWICTECGDSVTIPTAYCSNCGARMNGKESKN